MPRYPPQADGEHAGHSFHRYQCHGSSAGTRPTERSSAVRAGSTGLHTMFIYILQSLVDGSSYVGLSENPDNRLVSHNKGEVTSTKYKRLWKIIHLEKHINRIEARAREKYLKSAAGRRWR